MSSPGTLPPGALTKGGAKHPARPIVWAYWALGVAFLPVAGHALLSGYVAGAVVALVLGVASVQLGRSLAMRIEAVQLTNIAIQELTRGRLKETEALLAGIAPRAKRGVVGRGVFTLRALIALYEGRHDESVWCATSAIEGRMGVLTRSFESAQIAAAHAVRGLAYVALGETAKAKDDADAAENSVHATPEVIARARLVRALVASRTAYHEEAFRQYLGATAPVILEHAMPRERALFRALRRMSARTNKSVYREQGRVRDDRAPSKLASWIAQVAPDAAAYVEGDQLLAERVEPFEEEPIESGVPSDVRALRKARAGASPAPRPGRTLRRVAGAGAALVVALVAASQLFSTSQGTAGNANEAAPSLLARAVVTVVPFVLVGALFVAVYSFARRQERALAVARRLVALGHRERAKPALEELVASRNGIIAANAGLELARIACGEARFAEAISRCDAAIARVNSQPLRAAAADLLLPSLMTESAVAIASRGGLEDADAELAVLGRDFPTYARLASSQLRVRLVRAVRSGDREAACAVARSRTPELPLPYREDILADLVLASRGQLTEEDLLRLDAELREDAGLRAWLDAVAPGLRDDRPLHGRPLPVDVRVSATPEQPRLADAAQHDESAADPLAIDAAEKRVEANG